MNALDSGARDTVVQSSRDAVIAAMQRGLASDRHGLPKSAKLALIDATDYPSGNVSLRYKRGS